MEMLQGLKYNLTLRVSLTRSCRATKEDTFSIRPKVMKVDSKVRLQIEWPIDQRQGKSCTSFHYCMTYLLKLGFTE